MNSYGESLAATATRTFEDMCFFFVSPLLSDVQRAATLDAVMEVPFHGPLSGRLVVRLSGGTLPVGAANMLGDAEGTADMQRDALGELANVICGNLLPVLGGTDAIYQIGAARPALLFGHVGPELRAEVSLGLEHTGRADLLLFVYDTQGSP